MSRLKRFAFAGLQILDHKKTAFVKHYGHTTTLINAGFFVVSVFVLSTLLPPSAQTVGAGHVITGAFKSSPTPLFLQNQTDLYQKIFTLQGDGKMIEADKLISRLNDYDLLGHVLAQRLLHPSYKASFGDLNSWMKEYPDHPQSAQIARLAALRSPSGASKIPKSTYTAQNIEAVDEKSNISKTYKSTIKRSADQNALVASLNAAIRSHVQIYEPTAALNLLNSHEGSLYIDKVEKDRLMAMIAAGYLYAGKVGEAGRIAKDAMVSSPTAAPMAAWVHGLSAWQMKNYKAAAKSFEITAESAYSSGWLSSAAAYWAARSFEKMGNDRRQTQWLKRAADHPRTFYGLLAIAALDGDSNVRWNNPSLSYWQEQAILSTPAGQRAEKLLKAGQVALAEKEIRGLYVSGDYSRKTALMAYAYDRKLPFLSMKLAHAVYNDKKSSDLNSALYPDMPWTPEDGYKIDRALLHAIARQESKFNPAAENKGSGATGLMQLMPRTAYHVAKDNKFLNDEGRALLKTPEVSLALGQKYVEELLNNKLVGQDLLSLAMAYNAGPGTLAKWKSERAHMDDPLLFIETIPFAETRNYVERVMANYWMYRMRYDQSNESLVALANGKWARYASQDSGAVSFADAR